MLTYEISPDKKILTLTLSDDAKEGIRRRIMTAKVNPDTLLTSLLTNSKNSLRFIHPYWIGALTSDPYVLSPNAIIEKIPEDTDREDLQNLLQYGLKTYCSNAKHIDIYTWADGHYALHWLLEKLLDKPQTFRLHEEQ